MQGGCLLESTGEQGQKWFENLDVCFPFQLLHSWYDMAVWV